MDNFCCSHRCLLVGTLVRGASVLITPPRPATYGFCYLIFLLFLFFFPRPQYVTRLYSSTLAKSASVQYRSRAPATSSAIGFGTSPRSIHL
jgi:hypothetical protein